MGWEDLHLPRVGKVPQQGRLNVGRDPGAPLATWMLLVFKLNASGALGSQMPTTCPKGLRSEVFPGTVDIFFQHPHHH